MLEQLWANERASVRFVLDVHNEDESRSPRAYTTVLTVMQRLQVKGLVQRVRTGRVELYEPTLGRSDYLRARADAEIDDLISEYGEFAVVQFARRAARLDDEARAQLRRLTEE